MYKLSIALSMLLLMTASQATPLALSVCAEPWPPFIFRENGKVVGIAADIIVKVARKYGLSVRYHFASAEACNNMMKERKADIIAFGSPGEPPAGWIATKNLLYFGYCMHGFLALANLLFTLGLKFSGASVSWVDSYDYPVKMINFTSWNRVAAGDTHESMELLARGRVNVVFDDNQAVNDASPEIKSQVKMLPGVAFVVNQPIYLRSDLEYIRKEIDLAVRKLPISTLDTIYLQHEGISFESAVKKIDRK
jgi:ABC-type amino acid transport substrate-binding protein